jgi:hypothetical protein
MIDGILGENYECLMTCSDCISSKNAFFFITLFFFFNKI